MKEVVLKVLKKALKQLDVKVEMKDEVQANSPARADSESLDASVKISVEVTTLTGPDTSLTGWTGLQAPVVGEVPFNFGPSLQPGVNSRARARTWT